MKYQTILNHKYTSYAFNFADQLFLNGYDTKKIVKETVELGVYNAWQLFEGSDGKFHSIDELGWLNFESDGWESALKSTATSVFDDMFSKTLDIIIN